MRFIMKVDNIEGSDLIFRCWLIDVRNRRNQNKYNTRFWTFLKDWVVNQTEGLQWQCPYHKGSMLADKTQTCVHPAGCIMSIV